MSKKSEPWFGMLEAGEKSSPVVRSDNFPTGNKDTIYLYNLKRDTFVEYKLEIVESKLRQLNKSEAALLEELTTAFNKAAKSFSPRGKKTVVLDEAALAEKNRDKANKLKPEVDLVADDAGDDFDLDGED